VIYNLLAVEMRVLHTCMSRVVVLLLILDASVFAALHCDVTRRRRLLQRC